MPILLKSKIFIAGVEKGPTDGTLTYGAAFEAELVNRGVAIYVGDNPAAGGLRQALIETDRAGNTLLVKADGGKLILPSHLDPYKLPPTTVQATAAQAVVRKHSVLHSIKCVVGAGIVLTVFDNQTIAAGTVLFTQTMSAGDEIEFPTPIQSINGIFASFTGTATFNFGVSDAL